MIKRTFILIVLLQSQFLVAQGKLLTAEKSTELFITREFDEIMPNEFNLDSIGVKIIRQFFYDKANYPDQESKNQYLDNPYYNYSSWEKKNLSMFLKRLEDPEY